jgi:hypothetical protein
MDYYGTVNTFMNNEKLSSIYENRFLQYKFKSLVIDQGFMRICDIRHVRLHENDCFSFFGCVCKFYGYSIFEVGLGKVEKAIFQLIKLKVL